MPLSVSSSLASSDSRIGRTPRDAGVLLGHHLDGHDRAAAAEHRAVVEHAPLVRGEAVEPGRDEPAERVGQLLETWPSARPSPSAPTIPASESRVTSSSRKNGLPPLRSSSARVSSVPSSSPASSHSRSAAESDVERVEREDDEVVAAVGRVPALLDDRAGGGEHHEPAAGEALEQGVHQLEHEVVGPVEVGEHDHDRTVQREPLGVGDDRVGGLLAGAGGVDAPQLGVVPHEVEQALVDAVDLGGGGALAQRDAARTCAPARSPCRPDRWSGSRSRGAARRPPATTRSPRRRARSDPRGSSALCSHSACDGELLGEAGLAHAGLAEHQQQRRPRVADRVLDAVAQQAQLGLATDEPGPVALGAVPGRGDRVRRSPRRDEVLLALGVDRIDLVVARRCGGWPRTWPRRRGPRPAGRPPGGGWRC